MKRTRILSATGRLGFGLVIVLIAGLGAGASAELLDNTNLSGGDFREGFRVERFQHCQEECARDRRCAAWSYTKRQK